MKRYTSVNFRSGRMHRSQEIPILVRLQISRENIDVDDEGMGTNQIGPKDRDVIPLRLFGREERDFLLMTTRLVLLSKYEGDSTGQNITFEDRLDTPYRERRFYRTVIGFHTVS